MADDEKFVMVSLEEGKAKKLADVMSNDTCRKILDYLSEKEGTESEISSALGIPPSTVHYNIKHLLEANLVSADEFHYSKKGKEVLHYKLANKYIIIAPKSDSSILKKLKGLIPAGLVAFAFAAILEVMYLINGTPGMFGSIFSSKHNQMSSLSAEESKNLVQQAAKQVEGDAAVRSLAQGTADEAAVESISVLTDHTLNQSAPQNASNIGQAAIEHISDNQGAFTQYSALWILVGAGTVILALIIWELINRKKE